MDVSIDLTGRRVLVTGASSGIGAATCRALAQRGASVAMLARRKDRLDELHAELGERTVPVPVDVTDLSALEDAVAESAQALGGLDAIIAVAGRSFVGAIATGTPERWRELVDLNLVSPLATVRYGIGHFPADGRRDVVLIGSTASLMSMPGTAIYSASKRGLSAAFEALRFELAHMGVSATLVVPGFFDTAAITLESVMIDGPVPENDFPMFVPDTAPAPPAILGDTIAFVIGLPEGVSVTEIVIRPTGQLAP
jgi:3-oxoacyl-[acyl-carrier protein] reductase